MTGVCLFIWFTAAITMKIDDKTDEKVRPTTLIHVCAKMPELSCQQHCNHDENGEKGEVRPTTLMGGKWMKMANKYDSLLYENAFQSCLIS